MIIWDESKNDLLKKERDISFEEIAEKIINHDIMEILMNPKRKNQHVFVISIREYTYGVPFIIDEHDNIILKTAYPSRKLHVKYRRK